MSSLSPSEREAAIGHLNRTRQTLLDMIDGLSDEAWHYSPGEGQWSIANCVEHIVLSERRILLMVKRMPGGDPATDEQRAEVEGKEQMISAVLPKRKAKVLAPERIQPSGERLSREHLTEQFLACRAEVIDYVSAVEADLKAFIAPHMALGSMSALQWIYFISAHSERHVRQMEEVKRGRSAAAEAS